MSRGARVVTACIAGIIAAIWILLFPLGLVLYGWDWNAATTFGACLLLETGAVGYLLGREWGRWLILLVLALTCAGCLASIIASWPRSWIEGRVLVCALTACMTLGLWLPVGTRRPVEAG